MSLAQITAMQNNANGGGLNADCNQISRLSTNSGKVNNGLATICHNDQSSCANTCQSLAQKYESLSNCSSCSSEVKNIYQNAYATLLSSSSSCQGLASRADQIAAQGIASGAGTGAGNRCANATQMSPQSMGPNSMDPNSQQAQAAGANPNDPYGCQANPTSAACQNCQLNPSSPTCRSLIQSQQDPATKVGFQEKAKNPADDPNSFNAASLADNVKPQMQIPSTEPQQQKADPIQNGGGSGFPGAGGGETHASLGSSGGHGGYAMTGASKAAGIDPNLTRSGGYSQPVGSDSSASSGGGGGGYSYGAGANPSRSPASQGMDLKKYLPGGELYAGRMAGMHTMSNEIAGKFADLWKNVSARMQEKCKLGELMDCR